MLNWKIMKQTTKTKRVRVRVNTSNKSIWQRETQNIEYCTKKNRIYLN